MRNQGEADILQRVMIGELSVPEAAGLLGYTTRTVYRRMKRFRNKGEEGLIHGLIGRPSNRAKDPDIRTRTVSLFRALGSEQSLATFVAFLEREEGISVCRESLRRWLMSEGLWEAGSRGKAEGDAAMPLRGIQAPALDVPAGQDPATRPVDEPKK